MFSLLIAFFLLSILTSFFCSLWEAVLLSISPAFTQAEVGAGTTLGKRLQSYKDNIDRPLAGILTLNTIAHTIGAIGVGQQATLIWADSNPLLTGLVVPVVMTLAVLILSEIIPKTIGATYWRGLAGFTATCLQVLLTLLSPLIWASQLITRLLKRDADMTVFNRSDFLAMAEIGAREGVIEDSESDIIRNLLRLRKVRARDVMTPRTVIMASPEETTVSDWYASQPDGHRFSRIPVFSDNTIDRISGFVLKQELQEALIEGQGDLPLAKFKRPLEIVHETDALPDLFDNLIDQRTHIALVVDEFGGTSGLMTMEDVLETLLGLEIVDESDENPDMRELAKAHWKRRASKIRSEEPPSTPAQSTPPADDKPSSP